MRIPIVLAISLALLGACSAGHQQTRLTSWQGASLEGMSASDGDWFLVGARSLALVHPFVMEDPDAVEAHLSGIEAILTNYGMFEGGKNPTAGIRAAVMREPSTDILTMISGFHDRMTKDIPTERGTAFYALGVAAGGLEVHARKESRSGMNSLVPSINQTIEKIAPAIKGLPADYVNLANALNGLIQAQPPFEKIVEALQALYAGVPTSVDVK